MKIAVMGAGISGILVALELAECRHDVILYDRAPDIFSGASLGSEGKLHLGFVYALDRSLRTGRMMIKGAAGFRPLIERWISASFFRENLSPPFCYAVPSSSMVSAGEVRDYFRRLSALIPGKHGQFHLTDEQATWSEVPQSELTSLFDPELVDAAFRTQEVAINTEALARELRIAISNAPRVELRMSTEILSVCEDAEGYLLNTDGTGGPASEKFDIVVNALWEERAHIDSTLGLKTDRPIIHRYKTGLVARERIARAQIPSVTFLVGCYGDSVSYSDSAYVSWYPSGMILQEARLRPSRSQIVLERSDQTRIIESTLESLRRLMPGAAGALNGDTSQWRLKGGYITAWGNSGIEERNSELHNRYDVGVHSYGRYHSIDTGKMTLSPIFAAETCARIRLQT